MSTLTVVDWPSRAACATADPDLFFPEPDTPAEEIAKAKQVCDGCPVKQACLEDAIRRGERDAICGGLTAKERAAQFGTTRVRRFGGTSARQLAVQHGAFLLTCLIEHRMGVALVAEELGTTTSAVYRAYLLLVPARPGHRRPKPPTKMERLLETSKEQMKTLERMGRSHAEIGVVLGTSQSVVSACLAVLRQREEAIRRLSQGGEDGLLRCQAEEIRIRRESGAGLTVDDVIEVAGPTIRRMHVGGMTLRDVAEELGMCRETVRKAYRVMKEPQGVKVLTQNKMEKVA